jgi:hypothetical protein
MKIIATVAALLALTTFTPPPVHADTPPLRDRVVICRNAENEIRADRHPCVWLAPLQGDRRGHSLVAHRGGLIRAISDDRARMLWLTALARTEVQGTNGGLLYQRINLCVDDDRATGYGYASLPCVWHSPTSAETPDSSFVVFRSGRQEPVTDAEARRLLLVVAYRR